MTQADSLMPTGSWPVMLTAFREDLSLDWAGIDQLTDWYIAAGSAGLFSACLSSEAHLMTYDEVVALVAGVVARAAGRVPVVAGAMGNMPVNRRIAMCRELHTSGADAIVLVTNDFGQAELGDAEVVENLLSFARSCKGVPLGLYECPVPFKRLIPADGLRRLAESGHFVWMKETSCDLEQIRTKLKACQGTPLRIYNANLELMVPAIEAGAAGFSGIFANFFPDVIAEICNSTDLHHPAVRLLTAWVTQADHLAIGPHCHTSYPALAKLSAQRQGLNIGRHSRGGGEPTPAALRALDELFTQVAAMRASTAA